MFGLKNKEKKMREKFDRGWREKFIRLSLEQRPRLYNIKRGVVVKS